MTTFTLNLNLPDELAERLAELPADAVNDYAVSALTELAEEAEPDPDLIVALRAGVADLKAGRLLTLEQAEAEFDASFEAARARVRAKLQADGDAG